MVIEIANSEANIIDEILSSDLMLFELMKFVRLKKMHGNELDEIIEHSTITLLISYKSENDPTVFYLQIVKSERKNKKFDVVAAKQLRINTQLWTEEKSIMIIEIDMNETAIGIKPHTYMPIWWSAYESEPKYFNYPLPESLEESLRKKQKDLINVIVASEKTELSEHELIYKTVSEIKKQVSSLENQQQEQQKILEKLQEENTSLKEIIYNDVTTYGAEKKHQLIPIDIYLADGNPQTNYAVYQSVMDFLKESGFEKIFEFKDQKGSWYKRAVAWTKEKITSAEVTDRLKEAEYAVEVNTILKSQSEVDKNQSEALLNIITSLKDEKNAALRIGSLIVVKVTNKEGESNVQARTLTIKELHILNKKPELLQSPQQILTALAKEINGEQQPPSIN